MSRHVSAKRRSSAFRPAPESLEDRRVLSWGTIPPSSVNLNASGNDSVSISSFDPDGNYNHTSSITRNEIDYRSFVAERSGSYTFEAKANGSKIDTVAALFSTGGSRLNYNDDASSGTDDSKFTYNLAAGTRYILGVTNYNRSAQGGYRVVISAAKITNSASQGLGRIYASGTASLSGTTLQLDLYGQTKTDFTYADHYIRVKILNRSGNAIHTSYFQQSFRTAGSLVPGSPVSKSQTWYINVSNLNLSTASRLSIEVGQL